MNHDYHRSIHPLYHAKNDAANPQKKFATQTYLNLVFLNKNFRFENREVSSWNWPPQQQPVQEVNFTIVYPTVIRTKLPLKAELTYRLRL